MYLLLSLNSELLRALKPRQPKFTGAVFADVGRSGQDGVD